MLRPVIKDMKEKLEDGNIDKFGWLEMKEMISDVLTKEKFSNTDMEKVVGDNRLDAVKRSFDRERNMLDNQICLNENLYNSIDNLSKCISFMQFIMDECQDILT